MEHFINIHNGYDEFFTSERFNELENILKSVENSTFFPEKDKIFRFTNIPVDKIKCIFLGMEPYASWFLNNDGMVTPEATGRSFEVASVGNWEQKFKQSSLRNILKSLYYLHTGNEESLDVIRERITSGEFPISQPHEWFDRMEEQGIVFLNASLTVKKDVPDTHTCLWDSFMTSLIEYINLKNPNIIWILAGTKAQDRARSLVDKNILCSHPRINGFVKECPFKYVKDVNWVM